MALFPSGGAAVKGRVLASFPSTVEGTGGISVSKANGVWTIEPAWDDLSVETTLADASARQLWIYNPDTDVYTRLSVQYLLDNLPEGPSGDDGSLIYEQTTAPATDKPANSLWIDSDSTDLDVYQLVGGVWTDTGINLKGTTGATGASYAGTSTSSQAIGNSGTKTFTTQAGLAYQVGTRIRAADASSPTVNWMEGVVTSYSSTTLAFTADKSLGSGTLTNWTLSVAGQYGADGAGAGDVTAAAANTADNRVVRTDGSSGKGIQESVVTVADTTGTMSTSGGGDLGITSTAPWGNVFLGSGKKIDWNNGTLTLTQSSDVLTNNGKHSALSFRGHDSGTADDTGYPGIFVSTRPAASGQHIDLVRSGNKVFSIGYDYNTNNLGIGFGQATDSNFTGSQLAFTINGTTLAVSFGTSNPITCGSIELGHASDTTISRASAGVIAVEGFSLYPNIPLTSKSAAYTTVLADANTGLLHPSADTTARTWTIDSNANVAYPVGTVLTFVNQASAGTLTISITSDTMRLAGAGTTGSRTLAANGVATAVKVTSTEWLINGTNLT